MVSHGVTRVQFFLIWNWVNCPTNGWTQLISDRLNESRPKISLSGNLIWEYENLGRASAGGVCHKTWLFSVSTKGKKQPEFKSQHFMGCLPFLQNCVCCYGLRDAAYVFIFCGVRSWGWMWKNARKKRAATVFSTSELYRMWARKASFCVCLSKENWFSVK